MHPSVLVAMKTMIFLLVVSRALKTLAINAALTSCRPGELTEQWRQVETESYRGAAEKAQSRTRGDPQAIPGRVGVRPSPRIVGPCPGADRIGHMTFLCSPRPLYAGLARAVLSHRP